MSDEVQNNQTISKPQVCYRCGATLTGDGAVCAGCGRRQYHICFCGNHIPAPETVCSVCGADWSSAQQNRHRVKHRKVKVRPRELAKYVLTGAMLAVVAAAILAGLVDVLARYYAQQQPDVAAMYSGMGGKLWLACLAVGSMFGEAGAVIGKAAGGAAPAIAVLLIGAALGAVYYLRREGYFGHHRHRHHTSRRRMLP